MQLFCNDNNNVCSAYALFQGLYLLKRRRSQYCKMYPSEISPLKFWWIFTLLQKIVFFLRPIVAIVANLFQYYVVLLQNINLKAWRAWREIIVVKLFIEFIRFFNFLLKTEKRKLAKVLASKTVSSGKADFYWFSKSRDTSFIKIHCVLILFCLSHLNRIIMTRYLLLAAILNFYHISIVC